MLTVEVTVLLFFICRADGTCRHVTAALFDVECTVHRNSQHSSTSRVYLEKKSQAKWKVLPPWELRIAKAGYRKNTKQPIKPTTFDPTSLELDNESFMDSLRAGLEEHVPSAVVKQNLKIL